MTIFQMGWRKHAKKACVVFFGRGKVCVIDTTENSRKAVDYD
jgi:hypothetical protein